MNLTGQQVYQKYHKRRKETVNDDDYLAWLRKQKSAFSNKPHGIVAAHFRTAANSGIGYKPPFSAIPLTRKEHDEQHRIGTFQFAGRSWWINQVRRHQQLFIAQGGEIPSKYLVENSNDYD